VRQGSRNVQGELARRADEQHNGEEAVARNAVAAVVVRDIESEEVTDASASWEDADMAEDEEDGVDPELRAQFAFHSFGALVSNAPRPQQWQQWPC
jgi:hypothetical protein